METTPQKKPGLIVLCIILSTWNLWAKFVPCPKIILYNYLFILGMFQILQL